MTSTDPLFVASICNEHNARGNMYVPCKNSDGEASYFCGFSNGYPSRGEACLKARDAPSCPPGTVPYRCNIGGSFSLSSNGGGNAPVSGISRPSMFVIGGLVVLLMVCFLSKR